MDISNPTKLELIYQQKQLFKIFEIVQQQIEQTLSFAQKQFNSLQENKTVMNKEIENLLIMFNALNYEREIPMNQNSQLKEVDNLISALIDKKMEKQKFQHLQQLLIISLFINSENLSKDLHKNEYLIFFYIKSKQIIAEALDNLGFQKINFEEFLERDFKPNTNTDSKNVDQQESYLIKYQEKLDKRYSIGQQIIQDIQTQKLQPLQNQFKQLQESLNESNIQKMNLLEIKDSINNLQNLLYDSCRIIQDCFPIFKNIDILSLRIYELRFLGYYMTSDRQINDIINIIYTNKKRFFHLIIKIYESDIQSTERDIQIVELIKMMIQEIQTDINVQLELLRQQQYLDNVDIHFQFGSDSVSSNMQTVHIDNCLQSVHVQTNKDNIKIYNNFTLKEQDKIVEELERDFIQIKEEIKKDLKKCKEKQENFEKQFINFIEERKNIKKSEKMQNLENVISYHDSLQIKFNNNAQNYQYFFQSFIFQKSPDYIFVFKMQHLLNLVSDKFQVPKQKIINNIEIRIQQLCQIQNPEQIMNLFIPYIILFEETEKLIEVHQTDNLLNFITDWIINERVKSFSYILIPEEKKPDEKTLSQNMDLFQKCWISEQCLFRNISFEDAAKQFTQEFSQDKVQEIAQKFANCLMIQSQESQIIQQTFNLGSNFHSGLQLLTKK